MSHRANPDFTAAGATARDVPRERGRRRGILVVLVTIATTVAACMGSREVEVVPDERFGHRFEESGPEGRRTIAILPPDSGASFFYYPVFFDTVHVRPASFSSPLAENGRVPVEVLVKGSLPDACTELHDVTQERFGHIIHLEIEMRRPQGSVCTSVTRPYRFYLRLDGMYEPGSYTLKLNNRIFPFPVKAPEAG